MQVTEEIKSRLSIVEVISSYVRLEKSGIHWKSPCPFHQERTPSFMVNEERSLWHCFGCNRGGDVFAFVMEIESLTFREALETLAARAGVELPQYSGQEAKQNKSEKERLGELLELATRFYEKQLWEGVGQKKILPYLYERGLNDEFIKKFRLGYAPDGWSHVLIFLQTKGFTAAEVEQAGLALKKTSSHEGGKGHYDRFRDRIMFPIDDTFGKIIGYSARVAPGGDESQAKYINTPETPLYHKSNVLYGISHAKTSIKSLDQVTLVEGNMDVIALHQAGVPCAVAVSGTALTAEQLRILKRYTTKLKLFFDMDAAGQKAARKSTELALQSEFQVKMVALPSGKDAADLAQDNIELLKQALESAEDAPSAFLKQLSATHNRATAEGKRAIVEDFGRLLLSMTHPVEREHWIQTLSKEIQADERTLRESLQKMTHGTTQGNSPSAVSPHKAEEYSSRAEVLRGEYIRLLLSLPGAWTEEEPQVGQDLQAYLMQHPLFFFILQAGSDDPLTLIEDQGLKKQAAEELFKLFQAEETKTEEAIQEQRRVLLVQTRAELINEIEGKEKLRQIEMSLRAARAAGDRQQEQKLLEEFVTLSARLAHK
jgi:DNA primase